MSPRHWEQTGSPLAQGVTYFHGVGETKAVANSLDHLAAVAGATGRSALAARLHGTADAAWASIGVPLEHAYRQEWVHRGIDAARAALGDEYEIERRRGESAGVDGALADALSIN